MAVGELSLLSRPPTSEGLSAVPLAPSPKKSSPKHEWPPVNPPIGLTTEWMMSRPSGERVALRERFRPAPSIATSVTPRLSSQSRSVSNSAVAEPHVLSPVPVCAGHPHTVFL